MPVPQEQQAARLEAALSILSMLIRCYSKTYHDPSELESIGYEVIGRLIVYDNCKTSWDGYVRVSLRNAFRDHIKTENRRRLLRWQNRDRINSSLFLKE